MWKKVPDCRKHKYCPLMEQKKEHLVYLIFDYREGGDELPLANGRYMTKETGQDILRYEMSLAQQLNKEELLVVFKGGDPTNRFPELADLCEWAIAESKSRDLAIRFELTVDVEHFAPEHGNWYCEYRDYLSLWARCPVWEPRILEFALVFGGGILYDLDLENPEKTAEQLAKLQKAQLPFRLRLKEKPEEWTLDQMDQYERLLKELQRQLPRPEELPWSREMERLEKAKLEITGDLFYGRCYDPNGWQWTCPALSQLNLYSWEMEEETLQEIFDREPKAALRWVCPGETLRWKENEMFLEHRQIQEYLFAETAAGKTADPVRKRSLRELRREAAEEKR